MHIHSVTANSVLPLATSSAPASTFSSSTAAAAATSGTSSSSASNPLQSTDSMFIQLLTAQLQNQSPIDPVDPSQFTDQLVEFNMLDQLSQINQTLQTAFPGASASTGSSDAASNPSVQGAF